MLRVTVEIDAGSLDEMETGSFARLLLKAAESLCTATRNHDLRVVAPVPGVAIRCSKRPPLVV